jgi:starch phosphorylase
MEASGTGNMKFMLNGALTIGTLDGANVEIRDAVGPDHFFLFGLTAEEVAARRPGYRAWDELVDGELARVIDLISGGEFSPGERTLFAPLVDDLVHRDPFFVLADFRAYADCQRQVEDRWRTPSAWLRSSILNTANAGRFSSDRAIREYAGAIWNVASVPSRTAR